MENLQNSLLQTTEFSNVKHDPVDLQFESSKVIGLPVKVLRSGREKPDEGWHIGEIVLRNSVKQGDHVFLKVKKPDPLSPDRGLEKIVPLENLKSINPEMEFLFFDIGKDYVLYKDRSHYFRIGLIEDVFWEGEELLVMLSPEGNENTAPLDRVKIADIIEKSANRKTLEKVFHNESIGRGNISPSSELKTLENRTLKRKNLVYFLKVTDLEKNQILGHAVDLSDNGFMLTASKPISTKSIFQLRLLLPTEIQGLRNFEFSAVSRWCKQDDNPDYYNIGFQFVGVSTQGVQLIRHLIDQYSL